MTAEIRPGARPFSVPGKNTRSSSAGNPPAARGQADACPRRNRPGNCGNAPLRPVPCNCCRHRRRSGSSNQNFQPAPAAKPTNTATAQPIGRRSVPVWRKVASFTIQAVGLPAGPALGTRSRNMRACSVAAIAFREGRPLAQGFAMVAGLKIKGLAVKFARLRRVRPRDHVAERDQAHKMPPRKRRIRADEFRRVRRLPPGGLRRPVGGRCPRRPLKLRGSGWQATRNRGPKPASACDLKLGFGSGGILPRGTCAGDRSDGSGDPPAVRAGRLGAPRAPGFAAGESSWKIDGVEIIFQRQGQFGRAGE